MYRPWLVATACLLTVATQARAQSRWEVFKGNLKNSAGDAWDVWTSPLRGTGRDWIEAAGVVGGAVAGNAIEQNDANLRSGYAWRFSVELDDGRWARVTQYDNPGFRPGDRVIINGQHLDYMRR